MANLHLTIGLLPMAVTPFLFEAAAEAGSPPIPPPVCLHTVVAAKRKASRRVPRGASESLLNGQRKPNRWVQDTPGEAATERGVQAIDESEREFHGTMGTELNFRDAWHFNVAAYELDKLLDIQMTPATVARRFNGRDASFTWWVDDVMMDEGERLKRGVRPPDLPAWNEQMWVVRVFDQLIYNTDRNLGNLLIAKDWRIWMIDHTRAFRWHKTLKAVGNLTRCDRRLLAAMKRLDQPGLQKALGEYLGAPEIGGLLARRDEIVRLFDEPGEAVLYDRR